MTTTEQTVPSEQKYYNPLIVRLEALEVKDKTPEGYYRQIKNNLYVGVKAEYLVARDFWSAKNNLKPQEFNELVKQLDFSGSTQQKYISIGSDIRLMRLYTSGKLPMKWTTQYLLTKLSDEQFSTVEKKLDPETTAKEISEIAKLPSNKKEQIANDLLKLFELELVKPEIDTISTFEKIVEKVKSALQNIPQIKLRDEYEVSGQIRSRVETVKEKLTAYFNKLEQEKAKEQEQKLKEMKKTADKKQVNSILKSSQKTIGAIA
jgi:hypothetical protein